MPNLYFGDLFLFFYFHNGLFISVNRFKKFFSIFLIVVIFFASSLTPLNDKYQSWINCTLGG